MSRRVADYASLAAAALAVALVGVPGVARADGMCVVVQDHAFEVGLIDSVDPAELETADPEAGAETPLLPRLLCTDSNDPRCSPLHASDTPASPDLPARLAVALPVGSLARPSGPVALARGAGAFGAIALLGPSTGSQHGLERPPR